MKLKPFDPPLLLIVDPAPTFPLIMSAILRRADCLIESIAFQTTKLAIFWLSGEMDQEKAMKRPLATSWDEYPPLRSPTVAIVSLSFSLDERDRVMDWLYVHARTTKIITTSTEEELQALGDYRDEMYWRHVVAHLSRPLTVEDVVERVVHALSSPS